jgi:hypothetical protein
MHYNPDFLYGKFLKTEKVSIEVKRFIVEIVDKYIYMAIKNLMQDS